MSVQEYRYLQQIYLLQMEIKSMHGLDETKVCTGVSLSPANGG